MNKTVEEALSAVAKGLVDAMIIRSKSSSLFLSPNFTLLPGSSSPPPFPTPLTLLPGSFNPLHDGHLALAAAACSLRPASSLVFELSVLNADKGLLPQAEALRRVAAVLDVAGAVAISRAPLFSQKSSLYAPCTFAIGADTAVRLLDQKYYAGGDVRQVLGDLRARGCSFVVGGRLGGGGLFLGREGVVVPSGFEGMFDWLSEAEFRRDVSSTELRARGVPQV
jgi:hypothetical protein